MIPRILTVLALTGAATLAAAPLHIERPFHEGAAVELGVADDAGVRVDRLRFRLPATVGGGNSRVGGVVAVDIEVSNTGTVPRRLGLAVALLDERGRLVGAATGGSRVRALRPGRAKTYRLVFDDVNDRAYLASTFLLTLESRD